MADQRISELNAAGALDDTELLAVVQGAETKRTTVDAVLKRSPVNFGVSCSDEITSIAAGAGKVAFRMPHAMTLTQVRASITSPQSSGSILTVDINKNGTSILSTKLTIDNGDESSLDAASAAVISDSALTDDCKITIDVDQAGVGAKGLKLWLIGYRA